MRGFRRRLCSLLAQQGCPVAGVHNLDSLQPWTPCNHDGKQSGRHAHDHVAVLQAFARALRRATEHDERRGGQIASSKGVLTQQ